MRRETKLSHICIASYFGGLGDSLQFSTLPELFSKAGKDVYVWDQAYFRNPEVKELVWGTNPYVKGTASGEWNAGDLPLLHKPVHENCISNWEILHGCEPTNVYPKIYYKAKVDEKYRDVVLVDFSSITVNYDKSQLAKAFKEVKEKQFPGKAVVQVNFKKIINEKGAPKGRSNDGNFNFYDMCDDKIDITSIFQYCDLMGSCHGLISTYSGASPLSSAMKRQNEELKSFCIIPKERYENDKRNSIFIFDNINYKMK